MVVALLRRLADVLDEQLAVDAAREASAGSLLVVIAAVTAYALAAFGVATLAS